MKKIFFLSFFCLVFMLKASSLERQYIHFDAEKIEAATGIMISDIIEFTAVNYLAAFLCSHMRFKDSFPDNKNFQDSPHHELLHDIADTVDIFLHQEPSKKWVNSFLEASFLTIKILSRIAPLISEEASSPPKKGDSFQHFQYEFLTTEEAWLLRNDFEPFFDIRSLAFVDRPDFLLNPDDFSKLLNICKKHLQKAIPMFEIAHSYYIDNPDGHPFIKSRVKFFKSHVDLGLGHDPEDMQNKWHFLQHFGFSKQSPAIILEETIYWIKTFEIFALKISATPQPEAAPKNETVCIPPLDADDPASL